MKKAFLSFILIGLGLIFWDGAALALSPPSLISPPSPINGTTIFQGPVTLKWNTPGAAFYNFQLISPDPWQSLTLNNYSKTEVTFNASALGTYRWQVQACPNALSLCSDRASGSFIVEMIPIPKPILISPGNGASVSLTPTLDWEWSGDPSRLKEYNVEIYGPTQCSVSVMQSFYYVDANCPLQKNNNYLWRVRAINKTGQEGPWSQEYDAMLYFKTTETSTPSPLSPPILTAPISGQPPIDTSTPNLNWNPRTRENPGCYEVEIMNVWSNEPSNKTGGTSIAVPTGKLSYGGTYSWRARASLENCSSATVYSDWSGAETFSIISAPVPPGQSSQGGAPPGGTGGINRKCDASMSLKGANLYGAGNKTVAYDGLVPCGKCVAISDLSLADAKSRVNEGNPISGTGQYVDCQFCHLIVMFKGLVDFILNLVIIIAILMTVVGGAFLVMSAGDPGRINRGKSILTSVVISLIIIFAAWLAVNAVFTFLGLETWALQFTGPGKWFTVDCPIKL